MTENIDPIQKEEIQMEPTVATATESVAVETPEATDEAAPELFEKKFYANRQEIIDRLSVIANEATEQAKAEINYLKMLYYKIRQQEVDAELQKFINDNGDPAAYESKTDDLEPKLKELLAVQKEARAVMVEARNKEMAENLAKKTLLCEKVEEIASREVTESNQWNTFSKEIEDIQKEWKTIGFASKKENQKIYDRFRAACDDFYGRKRDFYSEYKDNMNANLEKKIALCVEAEALKSSTDWKKTTDRFINLQKQWKEIGAVPRKKSEQLWKRFRAACDEFFAERDKNAKPENDFYGNLKAKQHIIAEISEYQLTGNEAEDMEAMKDFAERFQAIGFVPFKEKDKIAQAYKEAVQEKFPSYLKASRKGGRPAQKSPRSEKERLIQKYNALEQDIVTYENNIGFFAMSKNAAPLIKQMQDRIANAKEELSALAAQIRQISEEKE